MSPVPTRLRRDASIADRLDRLDWQRLSVDLDQRGFACTGPLLNPGECRALAAGYQDTSRFRSRIQMARHGFGEGEYQYFGYPLPPVVADLRLAAYRHLAPLANAWRERLGSSERFPAQLPDFLARCHAEGQRRPTPLLLTYGQGGYNRLHQDVYGPLLFPLQLAVLLSAPGRHFHGGEFVLTEQRPRAQSRAEVVPLDRGEGVIFAVHSRPVRGARGYFRATMRHGVSQIRSGQRFCLGIIFHDAT